MSWNIVVTAGCLSLGIAALHAFGGGPEFHAPALASTFDDRWKAVFSIIWHQVTAFLVINGVFLIGLGITLPDNRSLLTLVGAQNGAFVLLFLGIGWFRLGSPFVLMQWLLFLPVVLLLVVALLRPNPHN
ncbi:MAG: hypothetical protein HC844_08570 [Tabrizicola sp.]|nr:hypothetical protein [Tabrizicola sp.]